MALTNLTHPAQTDQPDVVIGVDTHKDFHVAVALATNGARLGECSIPANRLGYAVLQDWVLEMGRRPVFAVEGTGSFGAGLCRELMAVGYSVVEINRPDRSTRRRLGKDDAIDIAHRIQSLEQEIEELRAGWTSAPNRCARGCGRPMGLASTAWQRCSLQPAQPGAAK